MIYKKEHYELGEYDDLQGDDYIRLKAAWIRKIKRELKINNKEFYIVKATQSDLWFYYSNTEIYKYDDLLTESA